LSQQVGKIHEATRLALPTFGDSDSDSDDNSKDGDNLKVVRPKHLTPNMQLEEGLRSKEDIAGSNVESISKTEPAFPEVGSFSWIFFFVFFFLLIFSCAACFVSFFFTFLH
jgi:hypothetical protein